MERSKIFAALSSLAFAGSSAFAQNPPAAQPITQNPAAQGQAAPLQPAAPQSPAATGQSPSAQPGTILFQQQGAGYTPYVYSGTGYSSARYGVPGDPNSAGAYYSGGYIGGTGQSGAYHVGPRMNPNSNVFGPGAPATRSGIMGGAQYGGTMGGPQFGGSANTQFGGFQGGAGFSAQPQAFRGHGGMFGPSSPTNRPIGAGGSQGAMQYGWW